jgi:hypothetical protein
LILERLKAPDIISQPLFVLIVSENQLGLFHGLADLA